MERTVHSKPTICPANKDVCVMQFTKNEIVYCNCKLISESVTEEIDACDITIEQLGKQIVKLKTEIDDLKRHIEILETQTKE